MDLAGGESPLPQGQEVAIPTKKRKSALVTGGAGFIGSRLARRLEAEGFFVVVVDDFRSGNWENLIGFTGDVVAADVSRLDLSSLGKIRFDEAYHEASITDTTVSDPRLALHDNVEGFRNVLAFCEARRIPLAYASSGATYGIRTDPKAFREELPSTPSNLYGFTKCVLDNLTREAWARKTKIHLAGVRYFNVYGPGEAHKGKMSSMIWQLAQQMRAGKNPRIFEHGEQLRDFIHVDDAVEGTILSLRRRKPGIYNLGTGTARSFNDVVAALNAALLTHRPPEYFPCPYDFYQTFTQADLTASRRFLGFRPHYDLEDGIAAYMKETGRPV